MDLGSFLMIVLSYLTERSSVPFQCVPVERLLERWLKNDQFSVPVVVFSVRSGGTLFYWNAKWNAPERYV